MPAEKPSPFQLRKIGHVVLNVRDLDASKRFYTDVLGLEVSDRYPDVPTPRETGATEHTRLVIRAERRAAGLAGAGV